MRRLLAFFSLAMLSALSATALSAADWGDVTGKFLYDGTPPSPSKLVISKDKQYCGKFNLLDEKLVVGPDKGIKNIVVYMYLKRGSKKPAIHPAYEKSAKADVVVDNNKCRFEPRIVLLRTSQTLVIKNSDSVGHNTKIDTFINPASNPFIPAGKQLKQQYPAPERRAAPMSCSIHGWMYAYLLVQDHPYFALSDKDGSFTIKNVPAGEWTFQVWHETGYVSKAKSNSKSIKWIKVKGRSRGRFTINVKPGKNDIGTLKVPPSDFE